MEQEHLLFKGIPIRGSIEEFCQQLEAKGFTTVASKDNTIFFSGDFTGQNVTIGVTSTNEGKDVFDVTVFFEPSDEWNILVKTYEYYKDLYSRKYGKPVFSKEENPALFNSNTSLMAEIHKGTVTYGSLWEVSGGSIHLSIGKTSNFLKGRIVIYYRDSQNIEAKIQKDLEDI